MKMDDVTPEMVIEAARRVQKRLGHSFRARDVWYELEGIDKKPQNCTDRGASQLTTLFLTNKEVRKYIHNVGKEFGATRYVVDE